MQYSCRLASLNSLQKCCPHSYRRIVCHVVVLSRWRQDLRYGDSKPAVLYTEI